MIDVIIPLSYAECGKWIIIGMIILIALAIIYFDIMITGGIYTMWYMVSLCLYGIVYGIIVIWGMISSPDSAYQVINITWQM